MKRNYFILSGFCSCIAAFVLYFIQGPVYWTISLFLLLLFSLLTVASMLWRLSDRYRIKNSSLPVALRMFLVFLPVVFLLVQLCALTTWAITFTDGPMPLYVHLWGYFFLVGFACTISLLSRLAKLKQAR